MIKVLCVCDAVYRVDERLGPRCPVCGSTTVQRTVGVGAPRFVGCASGPHVETKALDPIAVDLTVKETHG